MVCGNWSALGRNALARTVFSEDGSPINDNLETASAARPLAWRDGVPESVDVRGSRIEGLKASLPNTSWFHRSLSFDSQFLLD
jgi:hypothetical protein